MIVSCNFSSRVRLRMLSSSPSISRCCSYWRSLSSAFADISIPNTFFSFLVLPAASSCNVEYRSSMSISSAYRKVSYYHQTTYLPYRLHTSVGTLIVATIYLQLIENRYMFRSFTVLHCSHQHCVQPVASDVEVVGYL